MFTNTDSPAFDRARLAANNWGRRAKRALGFRPLRCADAVYPTVPAIWPNRATRRAIKFNREDRLSAEWRSFLATRQDAAALRQAIRLL